MARTSLAGLVACLLVLSATSIGHAQDAPCLRIGSAFAGKQDIYDRIEENLRGVLATLDICIDVVVGPPKRLTEELLRGELDGELIRVEEYSKIVGDVAVLVEHPLLEIIGYLVVREGIDLSSTSIESLSVGILRGVKWHETAAKNAGSVFVANDMEQLMPMLQNRRVDGIMIGRSLRDEYPELSTLPSQVAFKNTGHFVLHRRHADLARPISEAIKAFAQRGCSFTVPGGGPTCSGTGELEDYLQHDEAARVSNLDGGAVHGMFQAFEARLSVQKGT